MIDPHLHDDAPAVTARTLREFAALTIIIFGGLAAWHRFGGSPRWYDPVLIGAAGAVGVLGLAKPEAIRPLFAALLVLTRPIGYVVSWLILVILFYGIFTPLGLLQRLLGRDVLFVRRPARASHWTPKAGPAGFIDYTRQS